MKQFWIRKHFNKRVVRSRKPKVPFAVSAFVLCDWCFKHIHKTIRKIGHHETKKSRRFRCRLSDLSSSISVWAASPENFDIVEDLGDGVVGRSILRPARALKFHNDYRFIGPFSIKGQRSIKYDSYVWFFSTFWISEKCFKRLVRFKEGIKGQPIIKYP